MLASASALPVKQAQDGQPVERGQVYVAAPDRHLLLIDGTVRLGEGPRENMVRPSIDPLFRSAALSYGPQVTGMILTGMLDVGEDPGSQCRGRKMRFFRSTGANSLWCRVTFSDDPRNNTPPGRKRSCATSRRSISNS
jgi:hypothetical protein